MRGYLVAQAAALLVCLLPVLPAQAQTQPAPAAALPLVPPLSGAGPAAPAVVPATAAVPAQPTTAEHHAIIKAHHLQRLADKLTLPADYLLEHCRYESEIATPAPAKLVALTFDDGPDPVQTDYILQILQKYGIHAAFFMIGEKAARYPELVAAVRAQGHLVVANHSWNHPNFHSISVAEQASEVTRTAEILQDQAAQPRLFRYPYGNASCETNALLRQQGYKIVGWHVDSCDWAFDHDGSVDAKEALSCGVLAPYRKNYVGHVLSAVRAHDGGIVLMHEIHPHTLRSLEAIIVGLQAQGFRFGSLEDAAFAASLR